MGDVCMDCEGMGCVTCSLTGHRNPVTERDARIAALEQKLGALTAEHDATVTQNAQLFRERDALHATVERVRAVRDQWEASWSVEDPLRDLDAALAEPTGGE